MGPRAVMWRLLGGATGPGGTPEVGADDWVDVFEGAPEDAAIAGDVLVDIGLEVQSRQLRPVRGYAHYQPVRSILSVRAPERDRAVSELAKYAQLSNLHSGPDPAVRPSGFVALAEFATEDRAERAAAVLQAKRIASHTVPARAYSLSDGVGYVISVHYRELTSAVRVIEQAESGQPGLLDPLDLAEPEGDGAPVDTRSVRERFSWFAWTGLGLLLALLTIGLGIVTVALIVEVNWSAILVALAAAASGTGALRALRLGARHA